MAACPCWVVRRRRRPAFSRVLKPRPISGKSILRLTRKSEFLNQSVPLPARPVLRTSDQHGRLPARILSFATAIHASSMLRNHEFVIRLLAMLGNGLNAFLLGWLVYRWLGSKLAAVTSGSLFLLPFYAHEAVLWASAYGRILGTCLSLLTLHAFNSAVGSQSKSGTWIVLGSITFLLTLLTAEFYTSIIIFIPLLALIAAKDTSSWKPVQRSVMIAVGLAVVALGFFVIFYHREPILHEHGTIHLNPTALLTRCGGYFQRMYWMTLSPDRGLPLMTSVFELGWATIRQSRLGIVLFSIGSLAAVSTVFAWESDEPESPNTVGNGLIVCDFGLVWFLVCSLFPGVLCCIRCRFPAFCSRRGGGTRASKLRLQ